MYRRPPVEIWIFDAAAKEWNFIRRFDPKSAPEGPVNGMLHAAADENDTVVTTGNGTWLCRIDASQIDADGATKFGGNGNDVERRTGPYDPAWFSVNVPPIDRERVKRELAALPANEWVLRPTPKLPRPNMDWGSAVFLPERDQIVRFSGGHSAYSGTAPVVYDVPTDRYSLAFAPEFPIEFVYSNDQVHGEWSFKGNPWMTGHTYKATGRDPHSKSLVFAAHDFTYFFDPSAGHWSRNRERTPFIPNMYLVTLATTSQDVVAWADKRSGGNAGLWRLTGEPAVWESLPLEGELPQKSPDRHGMAYDSKRDRLLLFSDVDKHKGDVVAYDVKTGKAERQNARGKSKAAVPSRETIYIPEFDGVLIGAHVEGANGHPRWPLYDCARNAWVGLELTGADPIPKGTFNNSMGLMYDPTRRLVWAVGQNSHVHVLRLDPQSVQREDWE
jgi:hypothetical protein